MRKALAGILVLAGMALTASAAFADDHAGGSDQTVTAGQVPPPPRAGVTPAASGSGAAVSGDARSIGVLRPDHDRQ